MKKQERQQLLKRLLTSREIERQEDFVHLLEADGIHVTQATISRDIKEMQLVKLLPNRVGIVTAFRSKRKLIRRRSCNGLCKTPTSPSPCRVSLLS